MRYLTPAEERLVELVHLLAYGTPEEHGLTLHEVKQFLLKPVPKAQATSVLSSLDTSSQLLDELKSYLAKGRL